MTAREGLAERHAVRPEQLVLRHEGLVGQVEHFRQDLDPVEEAAVSGEGVADLRIENGLALRIGAFEAACEVRHFREEPAAVTCGELGAEAVLFVENVTRPGEVRIARDRDRGIARRGDLGVRIGQRVEPAEPVKRFGEVAEVDAHRAFDPGDLAVREVDRPVEVADRELRGVGQDRAEPGVLDLLGEVGRFVEVDHPVRQILVERRDDDRAARREVLLEGDVIRRRPVGLQRRVAAADGEAHQRGRVEPDHRVGNLVAIGVGAAQRVDGDVLVRRQLIKPRAGDGLGKGDADKGIGCELEAEVRARQPVVVAEAHIVDAAAADRAGRALRGIDIAQAEVPAHRHRAELAIDIGLDVEVVDLLFDNPFGIVGGALQRVGTAGQQARRVIGDDVLPDAARIGRTEDDRRGDRQRRVHEARAGPQEGAVVVEILAAVGVEPAGSDLVDQPAIELPIGLGAKLVQLVIGFRFAQEADLAPPARIGEQHVGRVGVIDQAVDGVFAIAREGEGQRVGRARTGAAGAGVGFVIDIIAVEGRIAVVDHEAEVVRRLPFEVTAQSDDLRFRALGVGAQDRVNVRIGGAVGEGTRTGHGPDLRPAVGAPRSDRGFGAAEDPAIFGAGVEAVDGQRDAVGRLELQRASDRGALELAALHALTRVVAREDHAGRRAGDLAVVGLELALDDLGRDRLDRRAERPAHGARLVLVDIAAEEAVAARAEIGVERAVVVVGVGARESDLALLGIERLDRAQVDRAGNADRGELGVTGLVDDALRDQFGRELVEFDPAVVARRDDFTAVEEREAEVRAEAADRDLLRTAAHALGGNAGQTRERVRNREVGEKAEVFRRDHFDDRSCFALGIERRLDRAADPGDDDRVTFFFRGDSCLFGVLSHHRRAGDSQRQKGRGPAQQARACIDPVHFHQKSPPASTVRRCFCSFFHSRT